MLEIYNEEVRDLLKKEKTPQGGLRIKENVDRGFYGECPVMDYFYWIKYSFIQVV